MLFGNEGLSKYKLDDTRYLTIDDRLMITTNEINPECWRVSKVDELTPQGILKVTMKRDMFDPSRDNIDLMLCDYYNKTKDILVDPLDIDEEFPDISETFNVVWGSVDNDGYLIKSSDTDNHLTLNSISYFIADIDVVEKDITLDWTLELIDDNDEFSDTEKEYFIGLLIIEIVDDKSISIMPSKAQSLMGKKFKLKAQDKHNTYKGEIEMEVA